MKNWQYYEQAQLPDKNPVYRCDCGFLNQLDFDVRKDTKKWESFKCLNCNKKRTND